MRVRIPPTPLQFLYDETRVSLASAHSLGGKPMLVVIVTLLALAWAGFLWALVVAVRRNRALRVSHPTPRTSPLYAGPVRLNIDGGRDVPGKYWIEIYPDVIQVVVRGSVGRYWAREWYLAPADVTVEAPTNDRFLWSLRERGATAIRWKQADGRSSTLVVSPRATQPEDLHQRLLSVVATAKQLLSRDAGQQ